MRAFDAKHPDGADLLDGSFVESTELARELRYWLAWEVASVPVSRTALALWGELAPSHLRHALAPLRVGIWPNLRTVRLFLEALENLYRGTPEV